jgi:hypothetical protein
MPHQHNRNEDDGHDRLQVHDPLSFVEHRAAAGKPPMFKFDSVGDNVAGIATEVESVDGAFGRFDVISIIRRDGSECQVQATGAVLSRRLAAVNVGDVLGIRRIDDGFSPEFQKPYPNFEVTVVAAGGEQYGRSAGAAPALNGGTTPKPALGAGEEPAHTDDDYFVDGEPF